MDQSVMQDVRQYLAMLHKRRGIVITCLVVSVLVAVLYNYTTRPVYQATTQILIDRDTPDVLPNKELMDLVQAGVDYYQTQYQLLKSRSLAERTVERLGLQKSSELATGPMMNPWERVQRLLGRPPRAIVDQDGMPLSPTVAAFRSRVDVDPIPGTRLVNLRFNAYDPRVAADAVNALASLYIEQSLEFRFTTSSDATGWLSDRLAEQRQKVEAAEKALQEYREKEGLIDHEERQGLVQQKLETLNGAVLDARTERIAKETLASQLSSLSPAQVESLPLVMGSETVQKLKNELVSLQRDEARMAETLGQRHPDMVRVRAQTKDVQEKLRAEVRNVARAADSDSRAARSREARLQANLDAVKSEAQDVSRKAIQLGVLRREVETNRQIYQDLLTRTKQTGLETELKTTNIRVIEKAEAPRGPVSPQKTRNYQVAVVFGLLLGIGLGLLFESFDNTFKTPEDLKQHVAAPFLGMVPDVTAATSKEMMRGLSPTLLISKNAASAVADAYRVLRTNLIFTSSETTGRALVVTSAGPGAGQTAPQGTGGEARAATGASASRGLRTNLIFTSSETTGRALVVTSAGPGEGKTTTLANVAAALAYNGAKVLAIDADLRRPTLHQHFGLQKTPGLSDLIVGKSAASEAIQSTRIDGLQVLPCGYLPPNPAELLGSPMMKQVLEAVRSHYDWVLLDSPPILAMADAAVLCPQVEGVILLVAAETPTKPAVARAIDQIQSVGGKVLGVVLNKVNLQRNSYYYSQYYGEYYRSYYAEGTGYARREAQRPRRPSRPGSRPAGRA